MSPSPTLWLSDILFVCSVGSVLINEIISTIRQGISIYGQTFIKQVNLLYKELPKSIGYFYLNVTINIYD